MNSLIELESLAILLLLIISVVALAVNRLRIPYSVALVVVGLAITFRQDLRFEVTPELLLALFIPPVAFEAAFHIDWPHLRENLLPILVLAIVGVLLSTLVAGGAIAALLPAIPLTSALVFGALISATDPVAVIALFRASRVARRLSVIMEGESLLNDGTAIVIFNIALLASVSGAFDPAGGLIDFIRVSAGGVAIGGVLGWGVARGLAHIDDHLVETTLTTCLAFGSYLVAERLHTSGVLAVVAAGLLCGSLGNRGMSPTTRIVVSNFWEYLAFIANSLVFLLIGVTINIYQLASSLGPIAVAIGAVLLSRAIVVYGVSRLLRRTRSAVPLSWQHVLLWGGLRGAVSLALALSLPATLEQRGTLQAMTFGVVLFTLLIQATTMPLLLRRMGLGQATPRQMERDLRLGRLYMAQAAWRRLSRLHREGMFTGEVWKGLRAQHREERNKLSQEMQDLFLEYGELERDMVIAARRESLRAERAALNDAVRRGLISDEAYRKLVREVDRRIDAMTLIANLPSERAGDADPE